MESVLYGIISYSHQLWITREDIPCHLRTAIDEFPPLRKHAAPTSGQNSSKTKHTLLDALSLPCSQTGIFDIILISLRNDTFVLFCGCQIGVVIFIRISP